MQIMSASPCSHFDGAEHSAWRISAGLVCYEILRFVQNDKTRHVMYFVNTHPAILSF